MEGCWQMVASMTPFKSISLVVGTLSQEMTVRSLRPEARMARQPP